MRIVYMGTPEFAVLPLETLVKKGYEVGYVITQPDSARDRGKKLQAPPVKKAALALGLRVLQPEKLGGNEELMKLLTEYAPDLIVVAAYGKLLPKEILDLPRLACVNIHGSLLPKYRGAAPIQRSIMNCDEYTGVTIMKMNEGLDTGDMIAFKRVYVGAMNCGELTDELSALGSQLLLELLPDMETALADAVPQNDANATYAPKIEKSEGKIDFTMSPEQIDGMVRAFAPHYGMHTTYKGQTVKIWSVLPLERKSGKEPGTITAVSKDGFEVAAGDASIAVLELQLQGKNRMSAKDFLLGHKLKVGEKFE